MGAPTEILTPAVPEETLRDADTPQASAAPAEDVVESRQTEIAGAQTEEQEINEAMFREFGNDRFDVVQPDVVQEDFSEAVVARRADRVDRESSDKMFAAFDRVNEDEQAISAEGQQATEGQAPVGAQEGPESLDDATSPPGTETLGSDASRAVGMQAAGDFGKDLIRGAVELPSAIIVGGVKAANELGKTLQAAVDAMPPGLLQEVNKLARLGNPGLAELPDDIQGQEAPQLPIPLLGEDRASVTGTVIQEIAQFMMGFFAGGKILQGLKGTAWATKAAMNIAKGEVSVFAFMDPVEHNLANILKDFPALEAEWVKSLQTEEGGSELELKKRFKTAIADLPVNIIAEPFVEFLLAYRAAKKLKEQLKNAARTDAQVIAGDFAPALHTPDQGSIEEAMGGVPERIRADTGIPASSAEASVPTPVPTTPTMDRAQVIEAAGVTDPATIEMIGRDKAVWAQDTIPLSAIDSADLPPSGAVTSGVIVDGSGTVIHGHENVRAAIANGDASIRVLHPLTPDELIARSEASRRRSVVDEIQGTDSSSSSPSSSVETNGSSGNGSPTASRSSSSASPASITENTETAPSDITRQSPSQTAAATASPSNPSGAGTATKRATSPLTHLLADVNLKNPGDSGTATVLLGSKARMVRHRQGDTTASLEETSADLVDRAVALKDEADDHLRSTADKFHGRVQFENLTVDNVTETPSRVKEAPSIARKIVEGRHPTQVGDIYGSRIKVDSLDDVEPFLEELTKNGEWELIEIKDDMLNGRKRENGHRAVHVQLYHKQKGLSLEVQVAPEETFQSVMRNHFDYERSRGSNGFISPVEQARLEVKMAARFEDHWAAYQRRVVQQEAQDLIIPKGPIVGLAPGSIPINWGRIDTVDDVKQIIRDSVDTDESGIRKAQRGVVSFKEIEMDSAKQDAWDYLKERRRQATGSDEPLDLPTTEGSAPRAAGTEGIITSQKVLDQILVDTRGQPNVKKLSLAVKSASHYQRRMVPIDDVRPDADSMTGVDPGRATSNSPIVLDANGDIIDGRHRFAAAKARGDTQIEAMVPIEAPAAPTPRAADVGDSLKITEVDSDNPSWPGGKEITITHTESGGKIRLIKRADGTVNVLGLQVPEASRSHGIGKSLQRRAQELYPEMGGQVSSKHAAKAAYDLGRRPPGNPEATLEDVHRAIDEVGSVNLVASGAPPKAGGVQTFPARTPRANVPGERELLPDDPELYFKELDEATMVPIENLRPSKSAGAGNQSKTPYEKGVNRANGFMVKASKGETGKREPLEVLDNGDGTFTIVDGNSTYANGVDSGWEAMPVKVVGDGAAAPPASTIPSDPVLSIPAAEMQFALRNLWINSGAKLRELTEVTATNPSNSNIFAFRKQMEIHTVIQREVMGIRTETARALAQWRIPAGMDPTMYAEQLDLLIRSSGGLEVGAELAVKMSQLQRSGNEVAVETMTALGGWAKTKRAITQLWYFSLLSSPHTHMRNIIGNTGTAVQALYERKAAEVISAFTGSEAVAAGEAMAMWHADVTMLKDALAMSGRAARLFPKTAGEVIGGAGEGIAGIGKALAGDFKGGAEGVRGGLDKIKSAGSGVADFANEEAPNVMQALKTGQSGHGLGKVDAQIESGMSSEFWEMDPDSASGRIMDLLDTVTRTTTNGLAGMDELFKNISARRETAALALRKARTEVNSGAIDVTEMSSRQAEIILDPGEFINLQASREAGYRTFTKVPAKMPDEFVKALQRFKIGRLIWPFRGTPINLATYAMERTPLAPLVVEWRADIAAGGARKDIALARMLTGTAVATTFYEMALNNGLTGDGPAHHGQRENMERMGIQRNSVRIATGPGENDFRYFSYRGLEPISSSMSLAANFVEILQHTDWDDDDIDLEEAAIAITMSIAHTATLANHMSGLAGFFDMMGDPRTHSEYWVRRVISPVIPGGVAMANRQMDPIMRHSASILDGIRARTPGLSSDLPARHDLYGREKDRRSGIGGWYDFISPVYSRKYDPEPIDTEMEKLGLWMRKPGMKVSFSVPGQTGITIDMKNNPVWYERYVELAGEMKVDSIGVPIDVMTQKNLLDTLNDLVEGNHPLSQMYNQADGAGSDSMRAKMIRELFHDYRRAAREELRLEFPELDAKIERKAAKDRSIFTR